MVFSWQQGNTQLLRYQSGTQVAAGYRQNITWSNQMHRIQGSIQSPRCHQAPTKCSGTNQAARWHLVTHLPRWHLGIHLPRWHLGQPTYPGTQVAPGNPPTQVARWQHQHPGQAGWFAPPCATGLVWPQLHSDQDVRRDSARSAPSRVTTSQASMMQFTWPN